MASSAALLEGYLSPLLTGNRVACRDYVRRLLEQQPDAMRIYFDLLWPAMERVDKLYRQDKINTAVESMATRINRAIADQLQVHLPRCAWKGKKILIACAPGEPEELGAQMCADMFEARGWEVYFVGGGIPNDEICGLVGQLRPDLLLIFGTQPSGVPSIRHLIEMIHGIGLHPTMNIMVSGGVFNRADGLWKEVNADVFARSAEQVLPLAEEAPPRSAEPPKSGAPKKRRRRRSQVPAGAAAE